MNKLILLALIAFTFSATAQTPAITFEKKGLQFKNIPEGEELVFYYKFTNTGTADLKFIQVKPTCGCTVADWPKYPITPGSQDSIRVTFNTTNRPGYNAKGVNIESNVGEINLVFEVEVTPTEVPEEAETPETE